jgi:hypothetical protein
MFSRKTIFRFGRSQKLLPDTLECRKLLNTLIWLRYDFEVAPISISPEDTYNRKDHFLFYFLNKNFYEADRCNFKVVRKQNSKCV